MTPAEKRIAALRTSLKYSASVDRAAIRAMIVEIEAEQNSPSQGSALESAVLNDTPVAPTSCDRASRAAPHACRTSEDNGTLQPIPERAAVADLELKPPEARREVVDGAGSSSETNARQTPLRLGERRPRSLRNTGIPGRAGEGDGSSPPISCPGSDTRLAAALENPVPAARSDNRSGPEGGSDNVGEPEAREPPQSRLAPQAKSARVTAGRDRQPDTETAARATAYVPGTAGSLAPCNFTDPRAALRAEWQSARRALRQTGHEVVQYDGVVRVDGKISRDRSLYPPGATLPPAERKDHRRRARA